MTPGCDRGAYAGPKRSRRWPSWANIPPSFALWAAMIPGLGASAPAWANTGMSDGRVNLPDGPGSIGGVGQNADVNPNMGSMSYSVPLEVPAGFAGATPSLALTYNSMAGNADVGIGWELMVPSIERYLLRGVPQYNDGDAFAVNGSEELVRVATSGTTYTFRARFEGGFVRYTWHADAAGAGGYFEAEYPDGSRGFFGADEHGVAVEEARVSHDGGVFRYLLVATLDRFGHAVRYAYDKHGNYPLLREVSYLFTKGAPRYRMDFFYDDRGDVISCADMGFELVLDKRLSRVEVTSDSTVLRRYVLDYEETNTGMSRLVRVREQGRNGAPYPIGFSFAYTQSLAVGCTDCTQPVLVDMGSLTAGTTGGVDLQNGQATLLDINGDSLPDVLDTGKTGQHRFFHNIMDADGGQRFGPGVVSTLPESNGFRLSEPGVQVVDVNGDGFTDIIHTVANQVLCNRGQGDWSGAADCADSVAIDGLAPDEPGDADPLQVRFMDYDGDRRIDLVRTVSPDATTVLRNTPEGFAEEVVDAIGAEFDASPLQLGDINGDGLLDPVQITNSGVLSHRIHLGYGRWSPWREQALSGADSQELEEADLQDLNGDGLDDIVVVQGNTVKIALNRAGTFLPFATLGPEDVVGGLPTRTDSTSVLFADMNGSGTTDVVWITSAGQVHFLELYAIRPNLLTRIDNGIGGIQIVEYGTSAREQARDEASGVPWRYRLPQAMNVVTAIDSFATLTPDITNRREMRYHHGLYDGREKRYRGFEVVEQHDLAEMSRDSQEAGLTILDYDLGSGHSPHRAGLLLREQVFGGSAAARYRIRRTLHDYEDCPLAEVPSSGLRLPVRYACDVATETQVQEGRPEAEWVTLKQSRTYDGYGNVTLEANRGVIGMGADGAAACGPCTAPAGTRSGACGPQCLGDEAYRETEYIAPGAATAGLWLLGQPSRSIAYGSEDGAYSETLMYYDGKPFVGLDRGQLTKGLVSRTCVRETPGAADDCQGPGWIAANRSAYDAHGNAIETLDPLGSADDASGHRRRVEYDSYQLKPAAVEIFLSGAHGPYRLRRELTYDPVFYLPAAMTRWMLVGAPVSSDPAPTRIAYDDFGRRVAIAQPGDSLDEPTSAFRYDLADPVSQIVVQSRSQSGQPFDLEQRQCIDGFGRTVQNRTRLDDNVYQVTGFDEVNRRGQTVRAYQPYQSGSSACDRTGPAQVAFTSFRYDALGRPVAVTRPDAELYGDASVTTTAYAPLITITSDPEDNDPNSPAYDTPEVTRVDGLGQVVSLERYLTSRGHSGANGQGPQTGRITALYDDLGRMAGYLDPNGNHKRQRFDLLGRVLEVDEPNAGIIVFAYDAAGNLVTRTDARGDTVAMAYDGANRLVAQYDPSAEAATRVERIYDYVLDCAECINGESKLVAARYPLGAERADGVDEVGYDVLERPVFSARTLDGHRFVIRTNYDNAGRVTATTYPDGTVIANRYDSASRLVGIDGVLDELTYDVRGQLHTMRYANGTRVNRSYDVLQRLAALETVGADGSAIVQGFGYHRDRVGNLLAIADTSSPRHGRPDWNAGFDHDPWYRVRSAQFGGPDGETIAYGYDLLDNMTSQTSNWGQQSRAHMGTYEYDQSRPSAVQQAGALDYEYDQAGNMLARGGMALTWDYQGRLVQATNELGAAGEYMYGPGVDRVMELHDDSVTYYIGNNFEVRDGIGVTYARVGRNRIARQMSAVLQADLLPDVAPQNQPDQHIDVGDAWLVHAGDNQPTQHLKAAARRLLLEHSGATAFLHHDHLGSLILATDRDGQVVGERAFYPTGAAGFASGHVDNYGFTGQRRDEVTGLVHFQFREFDTSAGRWSSPDPQFAVARPDTIGKWGDSTSGYGYVAGRLAVAVDLTGLETYYYVPFEARSTDQGHDLFSNPHDLARTYSQTHGGTVLSRDGLRNQVFARGDQLIVFAHGGPDGTLHWMGSVDRARLVHKGVDPNQVAAGRTMTAADFGQHLRQNNTINRVDLVMASCFGAQTARGMLNAAKRWFWRIRGRLPLPRSIAGSTRTLDDFAVQEQGIHSQVKNVHRKNPDVRRKKSKANQ